jgi:hypothetical protein
MICDLRISGDRRISGAQTIPISESDIRVNFKNPCKIIAAANATTEGVGQAQFHSSDGGATWSQTNLPLISGDLLHSDPNVDWTSDGTAWSITIGIDSSVTNLQLRSYKSTDGGASWAFDGTASGSQTAADKEMMWVDHSRPRRSRTTFTSSGTITSLSSSTVAPGRLDPGRPQSK